jgi:S-adenosylmethionine/arginine decarboxylase-like enzyme
MTPDNRHQHLIVRAEVNRPPGEADLQAVCDWMSALIKQIGMKELAAPRARYCPVVGNRGLTADAIIETSHCCLHTWDECVPAVFQFDLYTCSELNVQDVIDGLKKFEPTKIEYKFLDREHALVLVEETPEKLTFIGRLTKLWLTVKGMLS